MPITIKKTLYIAGFWLLLAILTIVIFSKTTLLASAEDKEGGGDQCTSIFCGSLASKLQPNIPDINWGDIFEASYVTEDKKETSKKIGKDIYEKIYSSINVLPERSAFKNTAGRYGTTEANMFLLINNNFSPILERSPNLTQEQALKKMLEIQNQFQEERELLSLQADIKATVEPNEIFMNGDVADSGFDLVNDLINIENLLFKKIDPIDIGGEYDEEGKETAAKTSTGASPGSEKDATPFKGLVSEKSKPGSLGASVLPLKKADGEGVSAQPRKTDSLASAPQSNADGVCLVENNLTRALTSFKQSQEKDLRYKETLTEKTSEAKEIVGMKKDAGKTSSGSSKAVPDLGPQEFEYRELPKTSPENKVKPAEAGKWLKEWLKDLPCGDIFCLKINYVTKPVTAKYRDHDNCIACHIEKINERLKETINHSLVPAKATGNLLEPGVCKAATADLFGSVGLRLHAIAKPVLTPTNDDLIYGSSVATEWEKFVNTYKPLPFYEKGAAAKKTPGSEKSFDEAQKDEAPDKEIEKTASKALNQTGPETAQSEVIKKIGDKLEAGARERAKEIGVADVAIKSDVDSGFYQAIVRELEQMNGYFEGFRNILESLHKKDGGAEGACVSLKSKKECK